MADMQTKDSKINSLNHMLKEKQYLNTEISLNKQLKLDLDTNATKCNKLLSDFQFNRLQKEMEVQQTKAIRDRETSRNSSYWASSGFDSEQNVFPVPMQVSRMYVEKDNICVKTHSSSSTNSTEEMSHIKNKAITLEVQNKIDCFKKERDVSREKCESTTSELNTCWSKMVAKENKQKQLLQQIERRQHNAETAQRHQEEKVKENEDDEYRDEMSMQNKALAQLEEELKENKLRIDQELNCCNVKTREFEVREKINRNFAGENSEHSEVNLQEELKTTHIKLSKAGKDLEKVKASGEQVNENKMTGANLKLKVSELKNGKENAQTVNDETIHHLRNEVTKAKGMLAKTTDQMRKTEITAQVLTEEKESTLVFEIENINKDKQDAIKKIERYSVENGIARDKLSNREKQVVEYKLTVEALQKELSTLNTRIEGEREEMLGEINTAGLDLLENQRNLEIKNEKIILLEKQLEESNRKDREYHEGIFAIKEENEKLNWKIHHASVENEELKREMRSTRESLENQLRIKDERVLELNYQLNKVCDKQTNMEKENMKKVKSLENELLKEREQVTLLCRRIDELLSNKREEPDAMTNADSRDFKRIRDDLERKIKTLQEKLEKQDYQREGDWSEKLLEANKKIKDLEDTLQTKSLTLEEERQDILAKTKEFVLQRENEYSEKVSDLEQELRGKKDVLMRKCEEICQLSHRLEVERRSKETLMKEVEDRENELELKNKTIQKYQTTQPNYKTMEADLEEEKKLTKCLQERCVLLDELVAKQQNSRICVEKELKTLKSKKTSIEEKDEQISALECQLGNVTKQINCVKEELENEKMNTVMLANEIVDLKEREVELEKRLLGEVNAKKMLTKDLEQIKQQEIDQMLNKSRSVTYYEEADSLKVSELECCIEELKNKIAEQEKKKAFLEESLRFAVEEKGDLQMKLNETLKENVDLHQRLDESMNKITSLEEKIIELQNYLIKEKNEDKAKIKTLKEEMVKVEEKCATWRSRFTDYEIKLQKERRSYDEEKQCLEKENGRLKNCYKETKCQLQQLEDERKLMGDRLLHFESKMVPDIESLRQELKKLKKELKNEKENAAKYDKLSKEYSHKLNKINVTESAVPSNITSNSEDILGKIVETKGPVISQITNLPTSPEQELQLKKRLQDSTISTPTLIDEVQVFMSPITRNLSNLGFSTPVQVKSEIIKPTRLAKSKINPTIPRTAVISNVQSDEANDKGMVKLTQQRDTTKKRKDESDDHGINVLKAKRTKISPFVLERRREIKTRSNTSLPSRLPQPKTRAQLQDSRFKIPRKTNGKTVPGKDTDVMLQFPKPKSSEAECKMQ